MTDTREEYYEAVLHDGDVSPQKMTQLVNVLLLGGLQKGVDAPHAMPGKSGKNKSQQLRGEDFDALAPGEFVEPRYNPDTWAAAMETNTRLGRSIRTVARNTVGLGWFVEPVEKISPKTSEEYREKVNAQKKKLEAILDKPNDEMPLNEIFYMMKIDEEAIGDGYIEVVRNNAGAIAKIYHAPGVTMRIRVTEDENGHQEIGGYVQIRGNEKRYFKEFGDTRIMNAETGKYHEGGEPLAVEYRATEILHFKLYSPSSTWYGAPRYVSAAPAITGNRLASLRNMKFFDNDAPQPKTTPVLTPEGWRPMGSFAVGDYVIGVDGKPHKILGVYDQGIQDVYRVSFNDGSSTECTLNHVWGVSSSYDRSSSEIRVLPLSKIMEEGFRYECGTAKWSVPLAEPVEYAPADDLPIDPYLMGLLLGNGSFRVANKGSFTFACHKDDVDYYSDTLSAILPEGVDTCLRLRSGSMPGSTGGHGEFRFRNVAENRYKINPLKGLIKDLGLLDVHGLDKFIPERYLMASVEDRLSLLQGLIDSDGCVSKTAVRYVSASLSLAKDVCELVGSLGGVATLKSTKNRSTYQVTIRKRFPKGFVPARIPRKAQAYSCPREMPRIRTMVGAEFSRSVETRCIKIDTQDGLYVTENFIVTHNTPRLAIMVSGGTLTPDSVQQIEEFFKAKSMGVDKAHNCMVIQAEQNKGAGFQTQGQTATIDLKPLTVGVTEDSSFSSYRKENDEEIREAFGISQVFYQSESSNRACLTGDTKVPLLDGRSLTMEELVEEYGNGESFWVYSVDKDGSVVPGKAHSPRMTKTADIWEVMLDNGEIVRGTDDHLFMMLDGSYKPLSSLKAQDRLKPLNSVVKVRETGETLPVYDITVDEHHNFALHCGVFVHNSAQIGREITNEQEFEPDRLGKEYILNQKLVADLLKDEDEILVRFRFARMKLTDPMDTARIDQTYAGLGALTPNELRVSIGKPPYPPEYEFADKPMQVAMAELSMKLAEAITGSWDKMLEFEQRQAEQQQAQGGGGEGGGGEGGEENPLAALMGDLDDGAPFDVEGSTDESTAMDPRGRVQGFSAPTNDSPDIISLNKGVKIPISEALAISRDMMNCARAMGAPNLGGHTDG